MQKIIVFFYLLSIFNTRKSIQSEKLKLLETYKEQPVDNICHQIDQQQKEQFQNLQLIGQGYFSSVYLYPNSLDQNKSYFGNVDTVIKSQDKADIDFNNINLQDQKIYRLAKQIQTELNINENIKIELQNDAKLELFKNKYSIQLSNYEFRKRFINYVDCYIIRQNQRIYYYMQIEKLQFDLSFDQYMPDNLYIFQKYAVNDKLFIGQLLKDLFMQLLFYHNIGITHNDIKPDNILLRTNLSTEDFANQDVFTLRQDKECYLVLSDFGLSTFKNQFQVKSNKTFSHPLQIINEGNVLSTPQMDIFSLCLSFIAFLSYKKEIKIDTNYYPNRLQLYYKIQMQNDSLITKNEAYKNAIENLRQEIVTIFNLKQTDQVELFLCQSFRCILYSAIQMDLSSIPSTKEYFKQIQMILNQRQLQNQIGKSRINLNNIAFQFKNCRSNNKINETMVNKTEYELIEFQDDCQDYQNSNKKVNQTNQQLHQDNHLACMIFDTYFYDILFSYQYFSSFQSKYIQNIKTNTGINLIKIKKLNSSQSKAILCYQYQFNFQEQIKLNLNIQQFQDDNGIMKIIIDNFINLFEFCYNLQQQGYMFSIMKPKYIIQENIMQSLNDLKMSFVSLPLIQINSQLKTNNLDFDMFFYPSFEYYNLANIKSNSYQLSMTCLYIFLNFYNDSEENIEELIKKDNQQNQQRIQQILRNNEFKNNHQTELFQQYLNVKSTYFEQMRENIKIIYNRQSGSQIDCSDIQGHNIKNQLFCLFYNQIQPDMKKILNVGKVLKNIINIKEKMKQQINLII